MTDPDTEAMELWRAVCAAVVRSKPDDKDQVAASIIAAKLAELRARIEGKVERKRFPILGGGGIGVDWQLVEDHGKQAQANHYQSVERLAQRGGLSWCELHAVLHNRKWQRMDEITAMIECRALEARYLKALEADHD